MTKVHISILIILSVFALIIVAGKTVNPKAYSPTP